MLSLWLYRMTAVTRLLSVLGTGQLTFWTIQQTPSSTNLKRTYAPSVQASHCEQCSLQFCIPGIGWQHRTIVTHTSSLLTPPIGLFGFATAHNKPSFIYTTFSNKIYVYHRISLTSISPSNLLLTYENRVSIQYVQVSGAR